jgi:serine phosphatase RsbU (regulator of sigma subunit)/PAS domain-containing protein
MAAGIATRAMATTSISVRSSVDTAGGRVAAEPGASAPRARLASRRRWTALCLAVALALFGIDVVGGTDLVLTDLLIVAPLLAATRLGMRGTATVTFASVALALVAFFVNDQPTDDQTPGALVVAIGGGLAIWVGALRDRIDRTARWTSFLSRAGTTLDASLAFGRTLEALARVPVPTLADLCVVDAVDPRGRPHRAAAAVEGLGGADLTDALVAAGRDSGPKLGDRAVLLDADDPEFAATVGDAAIEALRGAAVRSIIAVPLWAGERRMGALLVGVTGRRFSDAEMAQAEALGGRAVLALENARLFEELHQTQDALTASHDELEAILGGVADGVTAQDERGRLIFANEAAVRAMGLPSVDEALTAAPNEIVSRFEILTERGEPYPLDRLPGRRALAGEEPEPATVRFRPTGGGEERTSVIKARLVRRADGSKLVISVMEDVTDQKREERRARFLADAGELLGASLDYKETLRAVAQLAVPQVADWCGVDMFGAAGRPEPVALAHVDPDKVAFAEALRRDYPPDMGVDRGLPRVLRTGEPELYREIPEALLEESARDERHLELLRVVGLRSGMVVPMIARGRTLGAITFATSESQRLFDEDDLELGRQIAARAALAVDNARLYDDRSYIARRLQESLLPRSLPQIEGVELAARFRAAGESNDVGGDFYDVFELGPGSWCAVIGDVSGKGPDAATVTAQARYTLRAAALHETSPKRLLSELNEALLRQGMTDHFCTVVAVRLDIEPGTPGRLVACSGGHPLPMLVRADGRAEAVGRPGTLLGVVADPDLVEVEIEMHPDDALVLYTDGVTEARAPERVYGIEDLAALLEAVPTRDASSLAGAIEQEALSARDREPRDDIAILVLRILGD